MDPRFQIGHAPVVERRVDVNLDLPADFVERRKDMQDTLNRAASKAKARRFEADPITDFATLEWSKK